MATLNIGLKISNGGNISFTNAGTTTIFTTGPNEIGHVRLRMNTTAATNVSGTPPTTSVTCNVGGISAASCASPGQGAAAQNGDTEVSGASLVPSWVEIIVPPNTIFSIARSIGAGTIANGTLNVRGQWFTIANTQ
jgi:hypothetical protein